MFSVLPTTGNKIAANNETRLFWLRPYCYCPYLFHFIELTGSCILENCTPWLMLTGSPSIRFWERYSQTFAFISQAFCAGLHY